MTSTTIITTTAMAMTTSRMTRQRTAIAAAMSDCADFRSAQQIHAAVREAGTPVGLTTVYRAVQAMAEAGELDVITREDGEQAYRRCTREHHHHLVCRRCGRAVELEAPDLEAWADATARRNGFTDVSHTLEIFGTCADCR